MESDVFPVGSRVQVTSYGPLWPGDQKFEPVWQELNRRRAVIHVHPTVPTCCINLIPDVANANEEYLFDTARAITSLMYTGSLVVSETFRPLEGAQQTGICGVHCEKIPEDRQTKQVGGAHASPDLERSISATLERKFNNLRGSNQTPALKDLLDWGAAAGTRAQAAAGTQRSNVLSLKPAAILM